MKCTESPRIVQCHMVVFFLGLVMMHVLQGPSVEQNFWDFLSKKAAYHNGPPQVKCQLLISSIFDTMNC